MSLNLLMIAYIAVGGILGTLARYLLQGVLQTRGGTFPTGTLAINIAGSFLLGFIIRFATGSIVISPELRGGLTIGFCGAFTTMSTFSYESIRLLADGEHVRKKGLGGATVLRGVAGFGASSVVHTDKVLRLSLDLPLIIEIVDTEEAIKAILQDLDEMIGGGLITLERARVILYRPANETEGLEDGRGR